MRDLKEYLWLNGGQNPVLLCSGAPALLGSRLRGVTRLCRALDCADSRECLEAGWGREREYP